MDVIEQGIDQGAAFVSRGGMDDHAALFADNNDVGVLIENIQRDILRHDIDGLRLWHDQQKSHTAFRLPGCLSFDLAVDEQRAFFHQRRNSGAGKRRLLAQISVEPHAGQGGIDNQLNVFGFTHDVPPFCR